MTRAEIEFTLLFALRSYTSASRQNQQSQKGPAVQMESDSSAATSRPAKRTFRMPHIYIILFAFSAIAAITTHFIPAGRYDRVAGPDGKTAIDPDSFRIVESEPVGPLGFVMAIPNGFIAAAEVVFFTFIIGGMFMVIRETGIIETAVDKLTRRFAKRSILVVPVLMVLFAVIASLIGTQELSLVYVPVILPLMISLGFDSVTAAAVALCATSAGFTAGVLNPINTGLGQKIAGVPVFSGIPLRLVVLVLLVGAAIAHVMRYASKVRLSPERSLVHAEPEEIEKQRLYRHSLSESPLTFTRRQAAAGLATLALFGVLVWGVLTQGWFMVEMSGLFIVIGIVAGLIAGLSGTQICEAFNKGLSQVLVGAMIVGVARAVAVVFEEGQIMDTIVHALGDVVGGFPVVLSAVGMFLAQLGFNFLVPSGSGQALVTMPIMAPLSDVLDVTRQTAVLAYQLGDGLGNILYPTSGYFMATLALAGVQWGKWVRFFFPLFAIWVAIAIGVTIYAQTTLWTG
ncbi:YfcC family protein [Saccharopolyspora griseoalba]|uniref:YfcC family protein n=1 Tax=Saccharopolyspora griseoalba TaxID=1431848 RepID=A0ABW2LCX2_9PSEU